ncbi:MAG: S8 family serine peptidase [Planctomycetota bacterium]
MTEGPALIETLEQRLVLSGGAEALAIAAGAATPVYFDPNFVPGLLAPERGGIEWGGFGPSNAAGPDATQWGELQGSDTLRDDPRFSFADGTGYTAVVLDTGIDVNHPFFGTDEDGDGVSDRIIYQYDFANGDDDATDYNGHGSNVSSIIGSGDSSTPGVAPGVNIIHLKVFTDTGAGTFGYIEQALQWVVDNAATYNVVSVNMSLSDSLNHSTAKTRYGIGDEIEALADLGVTVVSAAGNRFYDYSSNEGVAYPAADPYSLAIGATYSHDAGGPWNYSSGARANTTGADRIAPFSQRSDTLTDTFAPGAPIRGAGSSGNTITMHGTSQASPQVAGAIVLAQQIAEHYLERWLDLDEIRSLLGSTGEVINDGDDEDDNVTNTGDDFARLDVLALAEAIWAMVPTNQAPIVDADANIGGVVAGQSTSFTYDDLVAALNANDADGDAIQFVVVDVTSGTLTLNDADVIEGVTTISSGDTLTWAAASSAFGSIDAFRVLAFDGAEYSAGMGTLSMDVNGLPTFDAVAALTGARAGDPFEITYDELLEASDAADPDGDAIIFEVVIQGGGSFEIDGVAVTGEATLEAGQTLRWTPPENAGGLVTALLLQASDGVSLTEGAVIVSIDVEPLPDPFAAAPGAGVVGAAGEGSSWVVTRSETGSLALFRQSDETGAWETIDLGEVLGLTEIVSNVISWLDPATGASSFAFATAEGLQVVTDQGEAGFTLQTLTDLVDSARTPVSGLTQFTSIDGRIGLAGITDEGELVLFMQEFAPGAIEWTFQNLSADDLASNGQSTPDFQGPLVSYVTSWNGLHIAGLDADGDIQAVWWAPGLDTWQASNLSAITGAPEMTGGLTAFITTWGAINLAGVTADGSLAVTWWMPSFEGEWRTDNLTGAIGGPQLQGVSASSFVTPWGALNVVGLRDDGEMVVYWWAPGLESWEVAALSETIDGAEAPVGGVSGVAGADGSVMLLGSNSDGDVIRYHWSPTDPWTYEVLTPAA